MMAEGAASWKEKGNQFYRQEKLDEALHCYTEASKLQPEEHAVQYELGHYEACIKTIDTALPLLEPYLANPQLVSRVLLRKAKAHFYASNHINNTKHAIGVAHALAQLNALCADAGIAHLDAKGAAQLLQAVSKPKVIGEPPSLSIFKPAVDTRTPEFHVVGHEKTISAFSGPLSEKQLEQLHEAPTRESHRTLFKQFAAEAPLRINLQTTPHLSFSFLFGGIGDARHLFSSLIDLETCEFPTNKQFHFTMVDNKAAVIARDLILLCIFNHLSKFTKAQMESDTTAIELLTLAHFTYLSHVMPNYLYDILIKIVKEVMMDLENKTLPSWQFVAEHSIPGVMAYLKSWLDIGLPTEVMLGKNNADAGAMVESICNNPNVKLPPGFDAPVNKMKEYLDNLTDVEVLNMPISGYSSLEKRQNLKELIANTNMSYLRDSMSVLPGLSIEHGMYNTLQTLFPPEKLMERHSALYELKTVIEKIKAKESHAEELGNQIKRAKRHIKDTFKPNPTFWDKWWADNIGEDVYTFRFSPFEATGQICDAPMDPPLNPTCTYDYMAPFFCRISLIIAKFKDSIKLEWVVGEVFRTCLDFKNTAEKRKADGFPVSFDRIYLSNIPDCSGGNLPIEVLCAPVLKTVPHAYITNNILLNTSLWKDYELFVQAYTLVPDIASHEKYLGMKHFRGDMWGEPPKWSTLDCPLSIKNLVNQDTLTNWLHNIFLFIVLPPPRDGTAKFKVEHPLNLTIFLIRRLAEIGYPHHWLVTVLDSLLEGNIKTKARPPPNSMNSHYGVAAISTKPFVAELEFTIATTMIHLPFSLLSPFPSFRFVSFKIDPFARFEQRYHVLSLYFCAKKDMNTHAQANLLSIRDDIINGDPPCTLLSTFQWDYATQIVGFWMCNSRLQQMVENDWHVKLIRLDNYMNVVTRSTRLQDIV